MTPSIDDMLDVGIRSSSEINRELHNGSLEDSQNPLDNMIPNIGGMSTRNRLDNNISSASHADQDDGPSGEHNDPSHIQRQRRHTREQLDQLESFYEKIQHPDYMQRLDLANAIGLEPHQVKFWFQNKRNHVKSVDFTKSTTLVREENDELQAINKSLRESLKNIHCSISCTGSSSGRKLSFEEHQFLLVENIKLKKKIKEVKAQVVQLIGHGPMLDLKIDVTPQIFGPLDSLGPVHEPTFIENKGKVLEEAVSAMEEFVLMARMGGLTPQGSKEITALRMNSEDLVRILMDEAQWSRVFSEVVARATVLEVVFTGDPDTHHQALHLINAEFQVASPLVQTRESHFFRYCFKHPDGSWTVTDTSLDNNWRSNNASKKWQRKPSGCLIEDMPDGYSVITWVEQVEVDQDQNDHHLYTPFVQSGLAFGAKRMISVLRRHYGREILASITQPAMGYNPNTIRISMHGRRRMLKLANRMVVSFNNGVGASASQGWTILPVIGLSDIQMKVRYSIDDPGHPLGTVLSAAAFFTLPVPHVSVFSYLRNRQKRQYEWDVLSYGRPVEEIANFHDVSKEWNAVSLLQVLTSREENQNNTLILQENYCDSVGSSIIYAPVHRKMISAVLMGETPDDVALLASGFAVYPDGPVSHHGSAGSLVTIAFQVLLSSDPRKEISDDSVMTVSNLITSTICRIKDSI